MSLCFHVSLSARCLELAELPRKQHIVVLFFFKLGRDGGLLGLQGGDLGRRGVDGEETRRVCSRAVGAVVLGVAVVIVTVDI